MAITKATASSIAPAAKGDLVVGSATNDASVLAVGTNGHTLVADSSTSTGLKWAAAASGGMTLISTTSLSGSSISFTSIPQTYIHLQLIVEGYIPSTAGQSMFMRFNGNSSANQHLNGGNPYGDIDNSVFDATEFQISADQSNSDTKSQITVHIPNYTNANTAKWAWSQSLTNPTAISNNRISFRARQGFFLPVEAITSFSIRPFNPNFSGGTAYLYGVK